MFEVPPDPKDIPWFENEDIINLIKLAVIALLFLSILLTIVRPVVKSFIGPVDDGKSNNELGDQLKIKTLKKMKIKTLMKMKIKTLMKMKIKTLMKRR